MSPRDASRPATYSKAQKLLHWLIGVLVICMIIAGLVMNHIGEGPLQNTLYDLHRSTGMVLLLLIVLRIVVRQQLGTPAPPPDLPAWDRITSVATHHLLYVFMFAMPLLGWAAMSAYGDGWTVFGLFQPPPIAPKDEALSDILFRIHEIAGITFACLIGVHVLGVLYHAIFKRDGLLGRMLPDHE
ncbi:cytochrome b [Methylovirgula sp. 4M-Z18]|uniref:cytochrome b n=1 Tax=Methylovirgula sp. 4M-Z18 TaxID=2293567 RepID=UPI000E2F6A27|nr:cytochrome b [Methylovirgula sp. 4M-Z18]RFB79326.1 cytochrome b [Methylovirgula sp. 4M-Z18]